VLLLAHLARDKKVGRAISDDDSPTPLSSTTHHQMDREYRQHEGSSTSSKSRMGGGPLSSSNDLPGPYYRFIANTGAVPYTGTAGRFQDEQCARKECRRGRHIKRVVHSTAPSVRVFAINYCPRDTGDRTVEGEIGNWGRADVKLSTGLLITDTGLISVLGRRFR